MLYINKYVIMRLIKNVFSPRGVGNRIPVPNTNPLPLLPTP